MKKNSLGYYRTTTNKNWQCMCRYDGMEIQRSDSFNTQDKDHMYWYKLGLPIRYINSGWWFWRVRK